MKAEIKLGPDEILFLYDENNTVGIVKASGTRRIFIETDEEEFIQFLDPDDLIAASCFSAGDKARTSIRCMLYLVRESGMPFLVLKKGHPASGRLPLVLSAGEKIVLSRCIVPGTHPEQDVLCGRGEMDGMTLRGASGVIEIEGDGSPGMAVEDFPADGYKNKK